EIEKAVDEKLPASCRGAVRFLLEVEISTIYKKGEKTRKVHHLIYAAHLDTAGRFRDKLDSIGNIRSDGRPILGLDSRHLLEITLESGPDAYLIPAHIWTPWFSAMGSKSGFDSIAECYGDLAEHIFAVETGLSSDPPMNWRVSHLDRYTLVSNSDAHSPPMLGREACCFDTELDYFAIRRALETREGWLGTVEFFPEEGKYHLDGHRKCGVRLEPGRTREHGGRCPTCGKPVTVGVLHRVEELSDREVGYRPERPAPFHSVVPLPEVVSEIRGKGPKSKAVAGAVMALTARLGPELEILRELPLEDVRRHTDPLVAEAVDRLRAGRVRAEGGYDGEYGTIRVFEPGEVVPQLSLAPLFGEDFAAAEPAAEEKAAVPQEPPSSAATEATTPEATAPEATTPEATDEPAEEILAPDPEHLPLLERLDADQRRAAEVPEGPLLIVAGPGSGKTRTLTHRLAHLVESGVSPAECLAVTFTRRAAAEMRERLEDLLVDAAGGSTVATFHGLGLELLRRHRGELGLPRGFRVADEAVRRRWVAERLGLSPAEARRALRRLERQRRSSASPEGAGDSDQQETGDEQETGGDDTFRLDAVELRELLADGGWVGLDDLIAWPVELLDARPDLVASERRRYRRISVDEYQDVDPLQYRLLRHLAPADGNLCAIGDPDQSIYAFRGAEVGFFLRFRRDYPSATVIELGRNYRSQPSIVKASSAVIRPESLAPGRTFDPRRRDASPILLHRAPSAAAEAEFIAHSVEGLLGGTSYFSFDSGRVDGTDAPAAELSFDDIAILVRTRHQMHPLLEALDRAGLPVQHRGHQRLAEHDGARQLLHHLYLALEGHPEAGLPKVPGTSAPKVPGTLPKVPGTLPKVPGTLPKVPGTLPKVPGTLRGSALGPLLEQAASHLDADLRDETLELLAPLAKRHGHDLEAFLTDVATGAEVDTWDPRAERISLLTLHAAKGLEFPVVFLAGCDRGLLPLLPPFAPPKPDAADGAEERRLFFVGMTRARDRLILTGARRRRVRGESVDCEPSPFLADLPDRLTAERRYRTKPRKRDSGDEPRQLSLL
ncbi:MAG: UvrD-helicase domain-containing protein, partial [Holophagales bacterium]|nr:UvrD-helicase domain-containing protein [Holophagales bacterium]